MTVQEVDQRSKEWPAIRGIYIPDQAGAFCAKHGLFAALDTAMHHVKECFPSIQQIDLEVIEEVEDGVACLSIVVHANGNQPAVREQYWLCLRRWSESFDAETLTKLVLTLWMA